MTILTTLRKKDFENILENYNIGEYKKSEHIFTGTNTIYTIWTTKGKFILKIYENASLKFIKQQINLMEFLNNKKVSTPKIINTRKGEGLLIYNKESLAIQKFVKGNAPKKFSNRLIEDIGRKFGELNKILLEYEGDFDDEWEEDHEFKIIECKLKTLGSLNLKEESKKLCDELKTINKTKLRKSVIHGDLNANNFLVEKNKLKSFIDWDDVHRDYLVYELCVFIAHDLVKRKQIKKKYIRTFVKTYEKQIKLSSEERKALYYFTKQRILSIACWGTNQLDKHHDRKKEILRWAEKNILAYKGFNKISLDKFLELLK